MKSTAKSQALIRDLKDKLAARFPSKTLREARDTNGWAMLVMSASGDESTGEDVIAIRIKGVDAVSKDVFGNDLTAFAPHVMELAFEQDANDKPIPSAADLAKVSWEAFRLGVKAQIKEIANGTAVSESSMDAADATAEIDDLHWPTKGV